MSVRLLLIRLVLMLFCLPLISMNLAAHEVGITDTEIKVGFSKIQLLYTLPETTLLQLFPAISRQNSFQNIAQNDAITSIFEIKNNDTNCLPEMLNNKSLEKISAHQIIMSFRCTEKIETLTINYRYPFSDDSNHVNYARVNVAGRNLNIQFTEAKPHHLVPVSQVLALWRVQLSDDALISTEKTPKLNREVIRAQSFTEFYQAGLAYFSLGVEHILTGYDHVLFLLGLLLLPLGLKHLLAVVTSFTLAHSITLALSVFNLVVFETWFIELAIAGSIVYVALENIWELRSGASSENYRSPWLRRILITFFFGLIHGFGFSFILREIGLGDNAAAPLVFFNLGVELGQLIIVALLFPLLSWMFSRSKNFAFAKVSSFTMLLIGSYYLVQRL